MPDQLRSALSAYLNRHDAGRSMRSLGPLVKLSGGFASNLCSFTAHRAQPGDDPVVKLVLKMYAPSQAGREHATREWRALTGLREAGYPVPEGVIFEPDARHLGHPFIVMDHVSQATLWQVYESGDPAAQGALTRLFVAQLVALHSLDPQLLEPAGNGTSSLRYIEVELEQIGHDGQKLAHAPLAQVTSWLGRRKQSAACESPVILHRDYHPWNVLVDQARRAWVIDWDWQVGDPRFDIAWTSTLMRRGGHDAFSAAVEEEYARQSGRSLQDLGYFEVLTTTRWLINVLSSIGSQPASDTPAQAAFRKFLVEPVQRAQELLHHHTGIEVDAGMQQPPDEA